MVTSTVSSEMGWVGTRLVFDVVKAMGWSLSITNALSIELEEKSTKER